MPFLGYNKNLRNMADAHIDPPPGGDKPRPYDPSIHPFPVGAALVAARVSRKGRCPHRPASASLLAFRSAYMALFSILIVFYPFYITIWS